MQTLHLLCMLVAVGAAFAKPAATTKCLKPNAVTIYTRVFSMPNMMGNYREYFEYVPDLFSSGIDDDIESVHQTGIWIYYENRNFNSEISGRVYWVHGIDTTYNFPSGYTNMVSSLRYAGSNTYVNDDTWTLYEDQYFCGNQLYGNQDAPSLGYLDLTASSLILTGQSGWTFYSGESYTGYGVCAYPNTDHDVGPMGDTLDLGIYPTITDTGIQDNSIRSVRKGCWSDKVVHPSEVTYEIEAHNGGWGFNDL